METTDEQIRQQAAECHARKIQQARKMSSSEKFFAGAELFDYACAITLSGIAHQHPHWSESQCRAELRRRLGIRELVSCRETMDWWH
jgi:hypothetical protein